MCWRTASKRINFGNPVVWIMKPTEKVTPEDHAYDSFFYNRCLLAFGDEFALNNLTMIHTVGVFGSGVFHGLRLAKS